MAGFFSRFGRKAHLRDAGDAARDRRDWLEAARLYRQYLARDPGAAGIWVQYGHALKESGELDGAGLAYARALSLEETNADTHLQIGHLHKVKGDTAAAVQSYKSAMKLDPVHPDAAKELRGLGTSQQEIDSAIEGEDAGHRRAAAEVDHRLNELERQLGPIKTQFERLVSQLSDTKALHFEMQRHKMDVVGLRTEITDAKAGQAEALRTEMRRHQSEMQADLAATHEQLSQMAAAQAEHGKQIPSVHSEAEALRAEMRRHQSEMQADRTVTHELLSQMADAHAEYAKQLASVHSDVEAAASRLLKIEADLTVLNDTVTGVVARTDEPLQRLVDQVAELVQTVTAQTTDLAAQATRLSPQDAINEALRTGIERHQTEMARLREEAALWRSTAEKDLSALGGKVAEVARSSDQLLREIVAQVAELVRAVANQATVQADHTQQMASQLADTIGRRHSQIVTDLAVLADKVAGVAAHKDDPLQGLVVQLADQLQALTGSVARQTTELASIEERIAAKQRGAERSKKSKSIHQPV